MNYVPLNTHKKTSCNFLNVMKMLTRFQDKGRVRKREDRAQKT